MIEVRKPGIVVDQKNFETVIIDVAVLADFSVFDKEREKIPNSFQRNMPFGAVSAPVVFLNQLQTVAWKRKWTLNGKFVPRIGCGLFFDRNYDCHNDVMEILIWVKSDRVFRAPFAVLCCRWKEVTPKWITREEGKVPFVSISPQPEVSICN